MILNSYITKTTKKDNYYSFVISDLHYNSKSDKRKLDHILDIIKKNHYDGVFVVGDIIDSTNVLREDYEKVADLYLFFKELGSITPTYVTGGNHDIAYYMEEHKKCIDDAKTFKSKFIDKISCFDGIKVLENETIKLNKKGYTISSINIPFEYVELLSKDMNLLLTKIKADLNHLKRLDPYDENILLCHYPELILALKDTGELKNVHLSIAGHSHSGVTQIFPVEALLFLTHQKNRGLITPNKTLFLQSLKATKYLRGVVEFSNDRSLLINPAVTTLSSVAGTISKLDFLFYKGASEIFIEGNNESRKPLTKKKRYRE